MFKFKAKIAKFTVALLAFGSLTLISIPVAKAVISDCTSSQFTIENKSNDVFYYDNGTSITSNYVQFKITNKTGATVNGYWAKIENISNNKLAVATYETAQHSFLTNLASNSYVNMYWYLTASGIVNANVTFDVVVYNGDPGASGTAVCKTTRTLTKIDSTIAASANKVTSVIYSTLPAANATGSATFTATVKGQTGTIGAGPTNTKDVNLSPATASNFAAKNFRLSATEYRCGGSSVTETLYIANACSGLYTAIFTFQYLDSNLGSAANTLSPIMQIASGSQMKHTSTPSFTVAAIGTAPSNQVTTNAATSIYSNSATLNGTNDYGTYTSVYFCYSSTNPGSAFANNCTNKITAVSNGNGGYYANLTGLTSNTTYYFELTGENTGIVYTRGGVLNFLAKAYDTTTVATNVTTTTATLNGTQTGITAANVDTAASYFYYTTTDPGSGHVDQATATRVAAIAADATNAAFSAALTGLTQGTIYYYEILVTDINAVTYVGGVQTFSTQGVYTVTFDGNSQTSGTPSASSVTQASQGASISPANENDLAKTGYTFGGWYTNTSGIGGTSYDTSTAFVPTRNMTLYAKWNGNAYAYNGSGATGTAPANQTYAGSTINAATSSFNAPTGYGFDGWCTVAVAIGASCSGTTYAEGAALPTPGSPVVTLYAIWIAGAVSLTYDGNTSDGGTVPSSQAGAAGASVTVRSATMTKTGNTFAGWNEVIGGTGTSHAAGSSYVLPASSLTFYAQWTPNKYSYLANTGTGTGPSDQTYNGSTLTGATNTFTAPSGYSFGGWCLTQPSVGNACGGTNYPSGSNLPTPNSSTVNLYAVWLPNKYVYDGNTGTGTGPSDQTYLGSQLTGSTSTFTAPSGYTFDGWCTTQPSVGGTCGGTKYLEGDNIPAPSTSTVTLYAIWKSTSSGGGGGGGGAPVYVPHPPTITSISAPEVCALEGQLTISGTYLSGATVTVDGARARVLSSSYGEITVALPDASVGTKEIKVTNIDGSATTTVKYSFADTPEYVNFLYPETYKDRAFSYTFTATDAAKYAISGVLPAGLTLNPLTGEISGTPTQTGDYVFTIIASNICDSAPLIVYMFVDKAFPNAYTCSVAFNVPASNNISDIKLAQLKSCLSRIPDLSPKYIDPVIFLSGGVPVGSTSDEALTHPRYLPIIDLIISMNLDAQIYYGAFNGSTDSVQLNVYWPEPSL